MTVRRRKGALWALALLFGAGALAAIAWGVTVPVSVSAPTPSFAPRGDDTRESSGGSNANTRDRQKRPPLTQLRRLASTTLREPLQEETSLNEQLTRTDNNRSQKQKKPLSFRLVGTVQEAGHSMAMFQKGDGTIEICPKGQSIDNGGHRIKVTRVGRREVTIDYRGQARTLTLPRAEER